MPSGFGENVMTPTHVLVVDDDADIRAFVRHALEREGMVVSVADSKQAMEVVLADDVIDILLLDVRLPDADGFDLLRDLRQTIEPSRHHADGNGHADGPGSGVRIWRG